MSKSTAIPRTKNGKLEYELLDGPLPPGEIAILFLHHAEKPPMEKFGLHVRCPITPAIVSEEFRVPVTSGTTEAFHISTDFPVSAYSIYPYGGAPSYLPSATVLLPTSSWDKSYLVVNAWPAIDNRYTGMKPTLQIVASEDDTEVRIRPNNDQVILPNATPSSDGRLGIYNLSKGQTLQIAVAKEFVGSPIEATKPVGVFGGATCLKFPTTFGAQACDVAQQQIPSPACMGHGVHRRESREPMGSPLRRTGRPRAPRGKGALAVDWCSGRHPAFLRAEAPRWSSGLTPDGRVRRLLDEGLVRRAKSG